ncbi:MAG: ABC transporter substrate-binding protein [Clostridiales bacterium]|nr:ABC transporter substrate-binding protein [Clostridiales bacterium]
MKKMFALILALAMAFSLVACGGSSSDSDSGDDASSASSAATSEASSSEDEAEASAAESEGEAEASETGDDTTSDGDVIVVGFAQVGHESDWRTASTESCQSVFTEENGYELVFVDCDQDSAAQLEAVRSFIQQEVDYIIIDPIVSTGWDTVLTECDEAGIPVIVIDRTIDDSDKYAAWVGSDFKTEGLAAGEWLNAYAEAKGITDINVLVIEGTTGASATIGRTEGFQEIADKYGWTILDSQDGDFTEAGGQEIMESYCKSYEGQFNVVICQNDNEAFGAMTAMTNAGVTYGVDGDVILISFDACTAGLEYVQSGDINADFERNPLAAPFVDEVIKQLEAGETPETTVYMEEHWYTYDDTVSTFEVDGVEQSVTVVTDEIVDAQY